MSLQPVRIQSACTQSMRTTSHRRKTQRGWLKLLAVSGGLATLWLYVLPWLATLNPLADHIQRMQRQDIAVEAMFYTDLNWQPPDGAAWRK